MGGIAYVRKHEYEAMKAEIGRLRAALTPNAQTKAAYIGEFHIDFRELDALGDEVIVKIPVPWDTVKQIMRAIERFADEQAAADKTDGQSSND